MQAHDVARRLAGRRDQAAGRFGRLGQLLVQGGEGRQVDAGAEVVGHLREVVAHRLVARLEGVLTLVAVVLQLGDEHGSAAEHDDGRGGGRQEPGPRSAPGTDRPGTGGRRRVGAGTGRRNGFRRAGGKGGRGRGAGGPGGSSGGTGGSKVGASKASGSKVGASTAGGTGGGKAGGIDGSRAGGGGSGRGRTGQRPLGDHQLRLLGDDRRDPERLVQQRRHERDPARPADQEQPGDPDRGDTARRPAATGSSRRRPQHRPHQALELLPAERHLLAQRGDHDDGAAGPRQHLLRRAHVVPQLPAASPRRSTASP